MNFFFAHNMLLWEESCCTTELADLFIISLLNEDLISCWSMILIMSNDKINSMKQIEYVTVMHHCNSLLCTISHITFYLFWCWNIIWESHSEFHQHQQWYNIKLLKGKNAEKLLSYEIQLEWASRIFDSAGLSIMKKTHAGHAQKARQAELCEVNEEQIHQAE